MASVMQYCQNLPSIRTFENLAGYYRATFRPSEIETVYFIQL
jgi:hypothetical protein